MSKKWFALLILPVAMLFLLGASCSKDEEVEEEEDQTSNWLIYSDEEVGFDLKYPEGIRFGEPSEEEDVMTLYVEKAKMDGTEFPLKFTKATAEEDKAALENGEYGVDLSLAMDDSQKVVKLGNKSAKEYVVLGRGVCDVAFERKLVFYQNDYMVVVTLYGAKDDIEAGMADYFTQDLSTCGDAKVWENKAGFYEMVEKNEGAEAAQKWYNDFDEIVGTIEFK